jgi:hypothetical protein
VQLFFLSASFLGGYLFDLLLDSEDGGITCLRNVGKFLPSYTASKTRRQHYSSSEWLLINMVIKVYWGNWEALS